jgi:hypothetical protein
MDHILSGRLRATAAHQGSSVRPALGLRFDGRFNSKQQAFLDFVLAHYVGEGVEELHQERLTPLLRLKYHSIMDALMDLGQPEEIGQVFAGFQNYLDQVQADA